MIHKQSGLPGPGGGGAAPPTSSESGPGLIGPGGGGATPPGSVSTLGGPVVIPPPGPVGGWTGGGAAPPGSPGGRKDLLFQ